MDTEQRQPMGKFDGRKGGKNMIEKVNPGHPDKIADRIAGRFIKTQGGFEKFAEWGLF